MFNILDKHKLLPDVQEYLKNEKEAERILRRSKREDLER